MLPTNLQFGRVRGEDRFYVPVKARKNQNQKQQQQQPQQQKQKQAEAAKIDENESIISPESEALKKAASAESVVSKTMRGWRTCDVEFQPYFMLGDLWESFKEWSVYGAGVPLVLDGSDCVVQYYVPYLSGIQLYGESTESAAKSRQSAEDSDGEYYRDSSSDGSSDYEVEKGSKFSRVRQGRYHLTNDDPCRIGSLSISDENSTMQEGFSSDDSEVGSSRVSIFCKIVPLQQIADLAGRYPGLTTLRSCDLLPISWMYPIYRIPTGPTLKDLDACFLTYHSLSTPLKGIGSGQAPVVVYPSEIEGVPKVSLPIFGMASYKFKGPMWIQNGVSEHQLANSLAQAAENWLRLLHVNHPDFQFFASHGMYQR
ncbi:T15D22.8 [Citrus sinensis]|nr:T15D22.8 [Citrus sinensis]